jgi:hypothetical protein
MHQVRRGVLAGAGGFALGLALTMVGCTGGQKQSQQREESGLKTLAILYMQFSSRHRGAGPANEAEFKKFIQGLPETQRTAMGVKDVEKLFVSDRDGKPYVILYGAKASAAPGPKGPSAAPVVGYEQTGSGGRRFVASALGAVEELDEAAFKQRVPDAKTP